MSSSLTRILIQRDLIPYSIKIPRALLYNYFFQDQDRPRLTYDLLLWDITLNMALIASLLSLNIIPATKVSTLLMDYAATFVSIATIILLFDRIVGDKSGEAARVLESRLAILVILLPFYALA
jgi:hypothetical protein